MKRFTIIFFANLNTLVKLTLYQTSRSVLKTSWEQENDNIFDQIENTCNVFYISHNVLKSRLPQDLLNSGLRAKKVKDKFYHEIHILSVVLKVRHRPKNAASKIH